MLREEFRLAAHQLGRMGFESFCDLRMQLLAGATQHGSGAHPLGATSSG